MNETKKQDTTLDKIAEQNEFCSLHLHNTLSESKACKREQLKEVKEALTFSADSIRRLLKDNDSAAALCAMESETKNRNAIKYIS